MSDTVLIHLNILSMKHLLFLFSISLLASCADAQSGSTASKSASAQQSSSSSDYKAHNEGWLVSLDEAFALSQKSGKPIMANFTGSDWCGWCIRLTNAVFSKPEFKTWADKNVVLLELDFPRRSQLPTEIKQQNQSLQQAFKVTGYPTVWVFHLNKDASGNYNVDAIGKTGYKPSVQEFTTEVDAMITSARKKG
jgi:thiol:disulfide interchange protein